jgi:hypothetical protein
MKTKASHKEPLIDQDALLWEMRDALEQAQKLISQLSDGAELVSIKEAIENHDLYCEQSEE